MWVEACHGLLAQQGWSSTDSACLSHGEATGQPRGRGDPSWKRAQPPGGVKTVHTSGQAPKARVRRGPAGFCLRRQVVCFSKELFSWLEFFPETTRLQTERNLGCTCSLLGALGNSSVFKQVHT